MTFQIVDSGALCEMRLIMFLQRTESSQGQETEEARSDVYCSTRNTIWYRSLCIPPHTTTTTIAFIHRFPVSSLQAH